MMKPFSVSRSMILTIFFAVLFLLQATLGLGQVHYKPDPQDVMKPGDLPEVGKWMLDGQLHPASWLEQKYHGKNLREPINVILVDEFAASADDAKKRLVQNCEKAGFRVRRGHSSGYFGYIAGTLYEQVPDEKDHAFSDAPFEMNNNHGRIFGPYVHGNKSYFIGAFSREIVDLFKKVKHQYGSFNQARDQFSQKMSLLSNYKIDAYIHLDNAILNDPYLTTGDHDGTAVLLRTTK